MPGRREEFTAVAEELHRDAERYQRRLKEDPASDAYFTTMIDLYALHVNFPGREGAEGLRDPYERVEALEKSWSDETRDSRFIPFIQLHEFEAPFVQRRSQFALFDLQSSKNTALQKIADGVESPERIDDGEHTAPSKRIIQQFPEYVALSPL